MNKILRAQRIEIFAEQRSNLMLVIKTLRDVPDVQFNMGHWWLEDGMAFDDDRNVMYKVADGPCGCVVGHLIQKGLLPGDLLKPKGVPESTLPYGYRELIWGQISNALKIYNTDIVKFLFSQYAYIGYGREIKKEDVIRRIEFVISEIDLEVSK